MVTKFGDASKIRTAYTDICVEAFGSYTGKLTPEQKTAVGKYLGMRNELTRYTRMKGSRGQVATGLDDDITNFVSSMPNAIEILEYYLLQLHLPEFLLCY